MFLPVTSHRWREDPHTKRRGWGVGKSIENSKKGERFATLVGAPDDQDYCSQRTSPDAPGLLKTIPGSWTQALPLTQAVILVQWERVCQSSFYEFVSGGSVWYYFGREDNGRFIKPGKVHIGEFFKGGKCALWKNCISANGTLCDFKCLYTAPAKNKVSHHLIYV